MIMKARNSSGSTAGIRAVLASLALVATIRPTAPAALGLPGHSPTPQTAEEKPLRRVELLILEDRANEVTVGLHVELAPGWYLYWLNPGDAGLAPAAQAASPENRRPKWTSPVYPPRIFKNPGRSCPFSRPAIRNPRTRPISRRTRPGSSNRPADGLWRPRCPAGVRTGFRASLLL